MNEELNDPIAEPELNPERDFEDLTEEEKAEAVDRFNSTQKFTAAQQYLANTDWYVTRNAETGVAIPEDVSARRAQARIDANGD